VTIPRTARRPPGAQGSCSNLFDGDLVWIVAVMSGLEHRPCPGIGGFHPHKNGPIPDAALPPEVRDKIRHYAMHGRCNVRQMEHLLAKDFPDLVIDEKHIRNAFDAVRQARKGQRNGQARALLELLLTTQHRDDPNLKIVLLLDDDDFMLGVVWVTGECSKACVDRLWGRHPPT